MKTALLVIDYINDIVHPKGKIASCSVMENSNSTFTKVNAAIKQARKQQLLLVHIKIAFSSDYHEIPAQSPLFKTIKQLGALQKKKKLGNRVSH